MIFVILNFTFILGCYKLEQIPLFNARVNKKKNKFLVYKFSSSFFDLECLKSAFSL